MQSRVRVQLVQRSASRGPGLRGLGARVSCDVARAVQTLSAILVADKKDDGSFEREVMQAQPKST
eukprot:589846-Rhodomonas_salina.2